MAYKGDIVPVILGRKGLSKNSNRFRDTPDDLIIATNVSYEDDSVQKMYGATALDTNGVSGAPAYAGTIASSGNWAVDLTRFFGTSIAAGGTATSAVKATGATTKTIAVPAGGYAAGSLVVVVINTARIVDAVTSVTDAKGNTYTATGAAIDYSILGSLKVYYSILTNALLAADLITVTWSADLAATIAIGNFTGVTVFDERKTNHSTGTSNSAGPLTPSSTVPCLLIAGIGTFNIAATPGASFTEAVEVSDASGGDAALHYRIDTTTPNIIAVYDWHSDTEVSAPPGTVSTTPGSAIVTGVGTSFTALGAGDTIIINAEARIISSVGDNTHLTTTTPWVGTNAGAAYKIRIGGRIITATSAGNLFKDLPSARGASAMTNLDAVALKGSLTKTGIGKFVAGGKEAAANNRKLFYFNGIDPVQVLSGDGTSTTDIATPPTDWDTVANPNKQPINGLIHASRLVAWGNRNDPHRLYFSDPDNHENFTSTASFTMRVASHIGDRIMCGIEYQGILVLWKRPFGIFYLDDSDLTASNWLIRTKSESLGCASSPYSVLAIDEDVIFLTSDGAFHMLSAVDTFGGVRASNLSYALGLTNWIRDNVNLERLDLVTSVWYPQLRVAMFGLPGTGETVNTITMRFDFSGVVNGLPVRVSTSDRDQPQAMGVRRDNQTGVVRPIFGEAGFVYQDDYRTAKTKVILTGTDYTASFQTAHADYSQLNEKLRAERKTFEFLELFFEPTTVSGSTVTATVYVDGVSRQTLTYDATRRNQKLKLNVGDGYSFSVLLQDSGAVGGNDVNVLNMAVYLRPSNEDQRT